MKTSPWTESKRLLDEFRRLDPACVYIAGSAAGGPVRIAWAKDIHRRIKDFGKELVIHDLVWVAGTPLANRLKTRIHRLFERRSLGGDHFDVPASMAAAALRASAKAIGVPVIEHADLIRRLERAAERRIERAIAACGA